jgi:hypothetical protein
MRGATRLSGFSPPICNLPASAIFIARDRRSFFALYLDVRMRVPFQHDQPDHADDCCKLPCRVSFHKHANPYCQIVCLVLFKLSDHVFRLRCSAFCVRATRSLCRSILISSQMNASGARRDEPESVSVCLAKHAAYVRTAYLLPIQDSTNGLIGAGSANPWNIWPESTRVIRVREPLSLPSVPSTCSPYYSRDSSLTRD